MSHQQVFHMERGFKMKELFFSIRTLVKQIDLYYMSHSGVFFSGFIFLFFILLPDGPLGKILLHLSSYKAVRN
jgi:hypothetical protein